MEAMSDNFATMDASQTWAAAVAAGIENQPNGNPNYASWDWQLLRRINIFLENYQKAQGSESEIQAYLARPCSSEHGSISIWFRTMEMCH